jgi:sugar phosphate isomerase/epimerase
MTMLTRRVFVAGAVTSLVSNQMLASVSSLHIDFPRDPRKRIAVATYPFRKFMRAPGNEDRDLTKPGMDLTAFARFVRSEFGVQGIEPLHSHFSSTTHADLVQLRTQLDEIGMFIANIPVDASVNLCSSDIAIREAGNATYRRWINIAKLLRSPSIRVGIPRCTKSAEIAEAVKALRPSLEYAKAQGIVINLENDDPVHDSASRVAEAIEVAHTAYLRALPDFGNGLMGGDEAFNANAVKTMFARAWNIAHVKDAEEIGGRRRTASLPELFRIAKAAHYQGYYSMESDSSADPTIDTKHLISETLRLI